MTEKKNTKWRVNWLLLAGLATIIYFTVLVFFLVPQTEPCQNSTGSAIENLLICRAPNELGDFLSGAFAPIAFLWLVAAVLIQAQELEAQREELVLTRQELTNSREVMKEQAEQAKNQAIQAQRQADFIGEQTENFKRQAEDYYREKQDRIFEETLRALHKSTVARIGGYSYQIATNGGTVMGSAPDFRNRDPETALFEMRAFLEQLEISLTKLLPTSQWPISLNFTPLIVGLEKLISMETSVSPSFQIKIASLGLKESLSAASKIEEIKTMRNRNNNIQ